MRLRCYTLFDIAHTGVTNRRTPLNLSESQVHQWNIDRNKQCNFDTILQAISLRSQPEQITKPTKIKVTEDNFENFGFLFEALSDRVSCWVFEFTVSHASVFNDGISELGALYVDCDSIPMINGLDEWNKLPSFLDTKLEMRNIYFEVISHE